MNAVSKSVKVAVVAHHMYQRPCSAPELSEVLHHSTKHQGALRNLQL